MDESQILATEDNWFRPVDITTGPDGAIYIADWYDSRLSHVDPRDTWSKNNGRVYRISGMKRYAAPDLNIAKLSGHGLIALLAHPNRWHRQQALQVFADRRDTSLISPLAGLMETGNDQQALEALWAINLSGGFNEMVALNSIRHRDPYVRMWGIRIVGEDGKLSDALADELIHLASVEPHPEVRSQLAATAKRLPGRIAVSVIENLLLNHDDSADPDIPLQIWWALESKVISDTRTVLEIFENRLIWQSETVKKILLERLMQRYTLAAESDGYSACARLIRLAPSAAEVQVLMNGLQEGLRGRHLVDLPPVLTEAIKPYSRVLQQHSLALALQQGSELAVTQALKLISDTHAPLGERLSCIRTLGEISIPAGVPVLLEVVERNQSSPAIRQAALQSLQRYDDAEIGRRVVKAYPDKLRADPDVRLAALALFASRPTWAKELLSAIDRKKEPGEKFVARTISKEDVPEHTVRQLKTLDDPEITAAATRLWPAFRFASPVEKTEEIARVSKLLGSQEGNPAEGRKIFMSVCGACHRLNGEGGSPGPDLSPYDRKNLSELLTNIMDPGAYVREGYATYRVLTKDGRVLSGTVVDRSANTITIRLISGERISLPDRDIRDMQEQPSMMPDNLLDNLSDDEIRDLFAYLMET